MGIGSSDNELVALEIIHRYVELLDKYFGNVSLLLRVETWKVSYTDAHTAGVRARPVSDTTVAVHQLELTYMSHSIFNFQKAYAVSYNVSNLLPLLQWLMVFLQIDARRTHNGRRVARNEQEECTEGYRSKRSGGRAREQRRLAVTTRQSRAMIVHVEGHSCPEQRSMISVFSIAMLSLVQIPKSPKSSRTVNQVTTRSYTDFETRARLIYNNKNALRSSMKLTLLYLSKLSVLPKFQSTP